MTRCVRSSRRPWEVQTDPRGRERDHPDELDLSHPAPRRLAAGNESEDPLDLYNQKRIIPNPGAPISLAVNPKLWLFFVAYPTGGAPAPKRALELLRDGRAVSRAEAALPAPDPDGLIRNIVPFPTGGSRRAPTS